MLSSMNSRWGSFVLAVAPLFAVAVTFSQAQRPAAPTLPPSGARGDAGAGKLPVPEQAAQEKALKLVLEVFQEDLQNARAPAARVKLAGELLQQGRDTRDDLA